MTNQDILSSTEGKQPRHFYGYTILAAAFLIFVVLDGTMYSFGVFLKPLAAEFGWTRAMTSGAFSLFQLLLGVFLVLTGRLNDRFGPRVIITVCGVLLGVGYILTSRINAIWQLYLFYGVITAMGMSGGLVPLPSTIARWFIQRRGLMTGIAVSGIGVGILTIPPLASWLVDTYDWRTSYAVIGTSALVLLVLGAQFLRRDPAQKGQVPYGSGGAETEVSDIRARGFSFQEATRTGAFWFLCAMYFCFGFAQMAIMTHVVPYATDSGISPGVAAVILSVIGGLSIAGRIGMGTLSDRAGSKKSLVICFIIGLFAFLWLLISREPWMLFVFSVVQGVAYGGLVVLMSPAAAELFGLRAHGTILGAIVLVNCIGGAVGPVLTGWIFDVTTSYQLAFVVCAALSAAGLTLAILLKTPRKGGVPAAISA